MIKSGYWHDLTSADFAAVDQERWIAVLPVGAIEQHGPHLPLSTDTRVNEGITRRALALLPTDLTALLLPTLPIGDSLEHQDFPGTLSLSTETLIALWTEIGRGVARAGVRKLVIFNTHGGQTAAVDIVAQRLRVDQRMLVARASYFRFGAPPGLFSQDELAHGIHGGEMETSMMLHLHSERVRIENAAYFKPLSMTMIEDGYRQLGPEGPTGFGWAAQDLHPTGVCGNAAAADAERGEKLVEHAARGLVEVIGELARLPLKTLKDR
jgi:creatinine amidohydrolase